MIFNRFKKELPSADQALIGRQEPIELSDSHYVLNTSLIPPYPEGTKQIYLGLGCFWGAERKFWVLDGVYTTAVGYAAGLTPNPSYEEVCTGRTGHNEVVMVVYDPAVLALETILKVFWESHNPTQGMRQGNDRGTQYRSGIYYVYDEDKPLIERSLSHYQSKLKDQQFNDLITTEIVFAPKFYFAEAYHQQYLAKNPQGYCGLGGTGVDY